MRSHLLVLLALPSLGLAGPSCGQFKDCYGCAMGCNWCHRDKQCHNPTFVNLVDPCWIHGDDIKEEEQCTNQPSPEPAPVPKAAGNSTFAKHMMSFIFKELGITDVDVNACVQDFANAELHFRDFGFDLKNKKYTSSFEELGRGISALANSVTDCKVQEVQRKLDTLAAAVRWANISTSRLDRDVTVIVGASNLWKDLAAIAQAVEAKNYNAIGDALNVLLRDWTSVEGGCKSGQTVCKFVDGLLKTIAATAKEVTPCEDALRPALSDFIRGGELFKAKDYKTALAKFAAGLDMMAKATVSDACGLKRIADTIGSWSPKLEAAIVKVESSSEVKILVGSADLYDELYTMTQDFEKKDYGGVGVQLGLLLAKLKASGCKTDMCIVVEGLLASMQIGFTDLQGCSANLDKTWVKLETLLSSLETKQWGKSLLWLGGVIGSLGNDVNACGVPSIGKVLQQMAVQLHEDSLAVDLGVAVQFLVKGADITPDIQKIIVDSANKNWAALGSDFGTLSDWLASTTCHTFTCKLMEGVLQEADMVLSDLKPCEDELRVAEEDFVSGATLWGEKQHKNALTYFASGLNSLALAVDACGLPQELKYLQQEANVLGLGNVSAFGSAVSILVHGRDLAEEIATAWTAFAHQDYRSAGSELQKAVFSLYRWTTGHLCTTDACYVFSGVLQYVSDLAKDIKHCGSDLEDMFRDFTAAYNEIAHKGGFRKNFTAIEAGVGDIGKGIGKLADSVGDCHLKELADILEKLAVKLGIAPHIAIVQEVLKIVIDGVAIEREVAAALEDFGAKNWPGFGYNVIKLIKTLLESDQKNTIVV
mmetsp:Transcript_41978/g.78506  ORF Transcript_41978/g.78506 Transcript_41978/m.78506 type:complete len:820 (+) Transcript_41978:69-2528(+)